MKTLVPSRLGTLLAFAGLATSALRAAPVHLVPEAPVSITRAASGVVLIDFGRVAFGNLKLTPPSEATGEITVHFGESLDGGRINLTPPGSVRYSFAKLKLAGNEPLVAAPPADEKNTMLPDAILTPPEWGVVTPFRWVEIEGWPGTLLPEQVSRQSAFASTWNDDAAAFRSSDETLNRIWELCRYSIKATTFAGVYVDGDRERIPYEADSYLNQLSHYATDNDFQMARDTYDHMMVHPTWPTEWASHMIFMAHADWMHTGDTAWLAPRYEALKSKLLPGRARKDGLITSTPAHIKKGDIVDWPITERDGFVFTPVNTVVNAFYIRSLKLMAELATALDKDDEAENYMAMETAALTAFQAKLFDKSRGIYRDGEDTDHSSQHASLFPLAFGLVPDAQRARLTDWVAKRGMTCSVYAAQYLMEGLFENEAATEALALITAPGDRSWKHIAALCLSISVKAGTPDAAALEARKLAALQDRYANPWPDPATSHDGKAAYCLAAYLLNQGTALADDYIMQLPANTNDFYFAMIEFLRILADPVLSTRMSASAREKLETVFLDYMDSGSQVERAAVDKVWQIDASENHNAIRRSVFYLVSKTLSKQAAYAGRILSDGHTVEDHASAWSEYWKLYFLERARKGLEVEIHSPTYTKYTLACYYNLHDLSDDLSLKLISKSYLDLYWAEKAQNFMQDAAVVGGSRGRSYKDRFNTRPISSSSYFLGWHDQGGGTHPADMLPMVTGYRCPEVISALARAPKASYEAVHAAWGLDDLVVTRPPYPPITYFIGFQSDGTGGAVVHSTVTDAYVMGTTCFRPDRDFVGLATQNRELGVFFNSTSTSEITDRISVQGIGTAQGRGTGYAEINGIAGRNCQIIWRDKRNTENIGTRVFLSKGAVVDNEVRIGDWWFSQTNSAFVAIRIANQSWMRSFENAGEIQTLDDPWAPIIIECALKSDYADFSAFQTAISANAFNRTPTTVTYTSAAGDSFQIYPNSFTFPKKNGLNFSYSPSQTYSSPYLNGMGANGRVTVSYPGHDSLVLDFSPGVTAIEAESAETDASYSPFITGTDPAGPTYMVVPDATGTANGNDVTSETGRASYPFDLKLTNDIKIEARVNFPDGNHDSFWHRIDDRPWTLVNGPSGGGWKWITLASYQDLPAGSHTLEIARRENGARIDQFRLTSTPGLLSLPRKIKDVGSTQNRITGNSQASNTISNFTVHGGASRKLIVTASYENGGTGITGITYGNASFTEAITTTSNPSSIWFLDHPPVGTGDIVVAFGGPTSNGSHIGVLSLENAAPGVAFTQGEFGTVSDYTTSANNTLVVEAYAANGVSLPVVPPALTPIYTGAGYSGHGGSGFRMIYQASPVSHDWGTEVSRPPVSSAGFLTAAIADAGPDQMKVDLNHSGGELVTLDGSASRAGNGVITNYSWTLGATELATGVGPTVELPVGVHSLTLTITDSAGVADSAAVTVTISTPPTEVIIANSASNYDDDITTNTNIIMGFSVEAGNNRKLVVAINSESAGTISSITFRDQSFSQAVASASTGRFSQIWYLDDPVVGTANIIATSTVNSRSRMGVLSLTNTKPGGPVVSNAIQGGANSIDLTPLETDIFVVGVYIQNGIGNTVVDPFSTTLYHGDSGSSWGIAGYQNESAAGQKSYAWMNSDGAAGIAVAGFSADRNPDSDADGMPDAWELHHFATLAKQPENDEDGDGKSNLEEYLAGTDPTNPNSVFRIKYAHMYPAGEFTIRWDSVTDRYYEVRKSATPCGPWLSASPSLEGTGSELSYSDATTATRQFYRVQVSNPQIASASRVTVKT